MTTDKQINDALQQAIIRSAWQDLLNPEKDSEEALDKMTALLQSTIGVEERRIEVENEKAGFKNGS